MPYIDSKTRNTISLDVSFGSPEGFTPGALNYVLTTIINGYLKHRGKSYTVMNEIVGVLEQVKDEFQRRVVHPYENEKCRKNGDVYEVEDPTDQNEPCKDHGKRLCACRNVTGGN